jgi:hypothetical protein
MKILTKNNRDMTVYDEALYNLTLTQSIEEDLNEQNYKVEHWLEVLIILDNCLHKGRFDFYEFLMESFTANI